MESRVVSNTGPIIHLREIDLISVFNVFKEVIIPKEVENEILKRGLTIPAKIKVVQLNKEFKDISEILTNQFSIDLGEAQAIALALQEKVGYFLTDDLEARDAAKAYKIEPHGSAGIILRAFREKLIDKKTTIEKVRELHDKSSLFITLSIVKEIVNDVESFREV